MFGEGGGHKRDRIGERKRDRRKNLMIDVFFFKFIYVHRAEMGEGRTRLCRGKEEVTPFGH